ncbi:hypothetical protein SAY86_000393 [Trapa natans]|uniref:Cytosine-specific methyltransferase n=1 Tax=Trapa natans TaxID=22666 RepID=A0AAN7RGL3_TRANT|nr:hypothetical protein SAY86_000393 [Trapa natans]
MDSTTLYDSLSNPVSKKAKKLLSPHMAVQRVDGDEVSSEDQQFASKCSTLKNHEERTMSLPCSEDKFLRRSPRLSSCQLTTGSSFPTQAVQRRHSKSRFSESDNFMPSSQEDSSIKLKSLKSLKEKSYPLWWNKDNREMHEHMMLHDSTCSGPYKRRSPRFSLENENYDVSRLSTRLTQVGQLRQSPRHFSLSGDTNIDINCATGNGSNKHSSKKVKGSEDFSVSVFYNKKYLKLSSDGNNASVNTRTDEGDHVSTLMLETDKEQIPLENNVSEFLGSKWSGDKINCFVGDPIYEEEAQERWHWRYEMKKKVPMTKGKTSESDDEDMIITHVKCHYSQATVNGYIYNLGDCVIIQGEGGKEHVGRILEFFRTIDEEDYFRVQWFYRAEDTVLEEQAAFHDKKRLFYSKVENDNPIDCIIQRVNVRMVNPKFGVKSNYVPPSDFYYDMEYCLEYSSFCNLSSDPSVQNIVPPSTSFVEALPVITTLPLPENNTSHETHRAELTLLDLFSGCGGMSTGLCLGAKLSSVNLMMRWSVDFDESACESLKLNHPETLVRNEAAEDFLQLLKEWEKLCKKYAVNKTKGLHFLRSMDHEVTKNNEHSIDRVEVPRGEYEVGSLVDICYGDPTESGKRGLKFKVRWKGYSHCDDTWEPIEGLSKCQERIEEFVKTGYTSKILPLPGDVDVICGGPPCQGISGYNRFRNVDSPLDDERNQQIIVFMDIVQFLKPKFVLMENVVDILRFDNASLVKYALSHLVHMRYQARLGTIAAGSYGLPQFRLRVFLWGAHPTEMLPQFPLPTHDVIVRYWPPPKFERNTVAYYENHPHELEKAAVLRDAISDLPAVTNYETCEYISYDNPPETELQRFLRSSKYDLTGCLVDKWTQTKSFLYDHRPHIYSEDNYLRICQVPKRKGANFRDFPGIILGKDSVARRDERKPPMLLPSGRPLVPDYIFNYDQGRSKRPFGRLWWDETVPTVLTFPDCRNQVTLHPEQDRVLTIRECARLQGFPDYYRFCGTLRERYCQVGNAVAIPVARALGYSMGMAVRKLSGKEPNMILPRKFSYSTYTQFTNSYSSTDPLSI